MKSTLYIVMPAYNEAENIEEVIDSWHAVVEKINIYSKLIIFDDGSKDDTYNRMLKLQPKYPQLLPIKKENSGHGSTCLYAYNYAISNNADFIFQTDSDGQTNPEEFWDFWKKRNEYNFIIGSRTKRMDGYQRIFVTKVLKYVIWIFYGIIVEDANTPFRLMRADRLQYILQYIPKNFFLSNVLISTIAVLKRERCLWIPISFKPRKAGVNSINFKRILKIGIKSLNDFSQVKKNLKNE